MPEIWNNGAEFQLFLDTRHAFRPWNVFRDAGRALGKVIKSAGKAIGGFLSSAAGQAILGGLCGVFGGPGAAAACAAGARGAGSFINRLVAFNEAVGADIGSPSSHDVPVTRAGRFDLAHLGQGYAVWPTGYTIDQAARANAVAMWAPGMRAWTPLSQIRQQLTNLV